MNQGSSLVTSNVATAGLLSTGNVAKGKGVLPFYRDTLLIKNSPPPIRTIIGPQAQSYGRVLGGSCLV